MSSIPADYLDLFEKRTIGHIATVQPDGAPHSTAVWIDYDHESDRLLVNSETNRRKVENVRADPRVSISMTDPEDPYRMLSVRGEVAEITTEGARDHLDHLATRYTGEDEYSSPIGDQRVLLAIEPEAVATYP